MRKLALLTLALAAAAWADPIKDAQRAFESGQEQQAFQILQQAANAGNAQALYNLSVFYSNGIATQMDDKKAVQLLEQSAVKGFVDAQKDLVEFYLQNKDFPKAARWLKQLADNGDAAAQYGYALMLAKGQGVPENLKLSEQYLEKSVNAGFKPALEFVQSMEQQVQQKGGAKQQAKTKGRHK